MKLILELDLGNSAYLNVDDEELDNEAIAETIISAAKKIRDGYTHVTLRDLNGNVVGAYTIVDKHDSG